MLLVACARDEAKVAADQPVVTGTAAGAASTAAAKPACPASGAWSECAIIQRLERSGLIPLLDSASATEPPLSAKGLLVRLGRAELEVYLYPDVATRERDQAKLDRTRYLAYTAPVAMEAQPTLMSSANALLIFHSRNDHQRERVGDAITAGPPSRPQ